MPLSVNGGGKMFVLGDGKKYDDVRLTPKRGALIDRQFQKSTLGRSARFPF